MSITKSSINIKYSCKLSIMHSDEVSLVPLAGCRRPKLGEISSSSSQSSARHDMCVVHPNQCPYEFVNPLDIDVMIDHPTCSSVSSKPIGHCDVGTTVEGRRCALTKDASRNPNSYQARAISSASPLNYSNLLLPRLRCIFFIFSLYSATTSSCLII